MHWPFTNKYNEKGDIEIQKIIESIEWSHKNYEKQSWSKYMKPSKQNYLILEVIPSSTVEEGLLIDQLSESREHLLKFVGENGIDLKI